MKKFISLILISLLPFLCFSQETMVNGFCTETNGSPLAYVNIVLLRAADSTLIKGTISEDDGAFALEAESGSYLIKASFVGFEDLYSEAFDIPGTTIIADLKLQASQEELDAVQVEYRRPAIIRKVDRLIFNVENTLLSSGNSFDILRRTPGVVVNQGELLVKNRPAVVYINDRKVYLTSTELQQLLEGYSGENVKSIEVITSPPAKYDAEGGSILNIVTSKNLSVGYKGSINASNTIAIVPKYTLGTSHYYKTEWLNAFFNYSYGSRYDTKTDEGFIRFFEPDGSTNSIWRDTFKRDTRTFSHSVNTILDFTLDEKNMLSLSTNLHFNPKRDSDISGNTRIFNPQNQLDSLYTTTSRLENDSQNILINLDYKRQLGGNGAELSANLNYINYNEDQLQTVATRYLSLQGNLLNQNSFLTLPNKQSNIYTGQLDYSGNLTEWLLETGIKYSGIDSKSDQDFFDTEGGSRQFISGLSDNFEYSENIYAGYVSMEREWESWSFKAGLRGEYTDAIGNSLVLGKVNNQNYFELFPTAYLLYLPSENHSFNLDYSRRINRPRFQSLNPFRYFLNENNFQEGDPNIQPSISNRVALNYTYKSKLSFDLYYDRIDDAMAILPFQDNQNSNIQSITTNLGFEQQFSFDVTFGDYLKEWWFLSIESSFFHMESRFDALQAESQKVSIDTDAVYFKTINFLTLDKARTFSALVDTYFISNIVNGSHLYDRPQFGLNAGIQKKFLNGRLIATIDATDLFNTMNIPLYSRYLDQDNSYYAKAETRTLRLGLKYNFGNFKLSDNNRSTETEEQKRNDALKTN